MSDTMLTQRLREMEAEGLLERRVLPTSPVRLEYYPTEKGHALGPVLAALAAWAEEWVRTADEPDAGEVTTTAS